LDRRWQLPAAERTLPPYYHCIAGVTMARKLVWFYVVAACLTLAFQIWVRSGVCGDACAVSYAKAVVWAVIWPVSWAVYIAGMR
jgi:hypothetical protein